MKISSFFCLIVLLIVSFPLQAKNRYEQEAVQEATSWFTGAPAPIKQLFYAVYDQAQKSPFFAAISPLGFLGMFYMWWKNQGLSKDIELLTTANYLDEKKKSELQIWKNQIFADENKTWGEKFNEQFVFAGETTGLIEKVFSNKAKRAEFETDTKQRAEIALKTSIICKLLQDFLADLGGDNFEQKLNLIEVLFDQYKALLTNDIILENLKTELIQPHIDQFEKLVTGAKKISELREALDSEKLSVASTRQVNEALEVMNEELQNGLMLLQERLSTQSSQFTEWVEQKRKESEENLFAEAILEEIERLNVELKNNNLSQAEQNIKNNDLLHLIQLHRLAILRPEVEGDFIAAQPQNGTIDVFSNFSMILSTSVPITARFGLVKGLEGRSEIDSRIGEFWKLDVVDQNDLAIYPVKLNEGEGANQPENNPLNAPYTRAMYTKRSFLANKEDNFICKIIYVCYTGKIGAEKYCASRKGVEDYIYAQYLRNPNDKVIYQVLFEDVSNLNKEGVTTVLEDAITRFSQVSIDLLYCTDPGACAKLSEFSALLAVAIKQKDVLPLIKTLILCAPEVTKDFRKTVSELSVENIVGTYSTGYGQFMTHRKTDAFLQNNIWVRITEEKGFDSNELSLEQLNIKVSSLLQYLVRKVEKKNIFTDFELYIRSHEQTILPLFTLRSYSLNQALLEKNKNFEVFGKQFEYYCLKKTFSDVLFPTLHEKSSEKIINGAREIGNHVIKTTANVGGTIMGGIKSTMKHFCKMYLNQGQITN